MNEWLNNTVIREKETDVPQRRIPLQTQVDNLQQNMIKGITCKWNGYEY